MEYEKENIETASIGQLATPPDMQQITKRPPPSCIREHINNLQMTADELRKRVQIQEDRILRLEKLVGV